METKKLVTGVEVSMKGNQIRVFSKELQKHPLLNLPIRGRIQNKFVPENRLDINKWFDKNF